MKNLRCLSFLLCTLMIVLNGCQKPIVFVEGSGPSGGIPTKVNSTMSGKVDGRLVECSIAIAQYTAARNGSPADLQINGIKDNESFQLTWSDFKGVGTYDAKDIISAGVFYNGTDAFKNAFFSLSGIIKITTFTDKLIVGTFEFKGANTSNEAKTITEGKFSISLESAVGPTPSTGDKTMSAKVDGTLVNFVGDGTYIKSAGFGNMMTMYGLNGTKIISIAIENFKGVGTYIIDGDGTGSYHDNQTEAGTFATETGKVTGKVTITSFTATRVVGTFNFSAPQQSGLTNVVRLITDGKFDLAYLTTTI